MAVQAILTRTGRTLYKDAKGQFISKRKYQLEMRRGPSGRFLSSANAARQQQVEQWLRAQLGAPPAGKMWAQIAGKYPDRFTDYLEDLNA